MRIVGVDVARSVAITMAMASHVWAETDLSRYSPDELSLVLRFIFQVATPTFILLFGTMLEFVYLPRWADPAARPGVAVRLMSRALQCWILYAISIFALFLVDDGYSLPFSIGTVLFMGNSPYTEILKFYAVVLALAPLLLWAREKWGLIPLIAASLLWQVAWLWLSKLPDAQNDLGLPLHAARIVKFVTGFGDLPLAGPSVMHGLTLVVVGLCLGSFLADSAARENLGRRVSGLLTASTLVAVLGFIVMPQGTFAAMSNMSLRMISHPFYFAIGAVMAVWLTAFCILLGDILNIGSKAGWARTTFFGRTSMFTFAWGNILLYLVQPEPQDLNSTLLWAALLLAAICAMSFFFDQAVRRSEFVGTAMKKIKRITDGIARWFVQAISGRMASWNT